MERERSEQGQLRRERAELQVLWDLGVCDSISLTGNVRQPAGRLQIREPRPQRLELLITPEAVHLTRSFIARPVPVKYTARDTFTTTAETDAEAKSLLRHFNMPFSN